MDTLAFVRIAASLTVLGIVGWLAARRIAFLVRLLAKARPMPERMGRWGKKLRWQLRHVLAQQKILKWTGPGILHTFVFWGFIILQSQTVEAVGEVFDPDFHIPFLPPGTFRSELLGFLQDLFTALVLVGTAGFALIRLVQSPQRLGRRSRFAHSNLLQGWWVLLFEFGLLYTVLVLRAARAVKGTLPYPEGAFVSTRLAGALDGLSAVQLEVVATAFLVAHLTIFSAFLLFTLHSKHLHVFTIVPNVLFARQPKALGKLEAEPIDVEAMSEDDVLGVGELEHFGFKRLLDMYTCTECGRCQSQCPAWNTGKPLNPKLVITDLRDHLYAKGPYLLDPAKAEADPDAEPLGKVLVGDEPGQANAVLDFDVLWTCTTCGACVEECPVDIEHVDHILDLRRYKAQMESSFPPEATTMLRNLENAGDPWGLGSAKRLDWAAGLDVAVVDGQVPADVEYLLWVGCAGALEDRAKKVTRTVAELLTAAGVRFAVLGPAEACTGDPARRLGMEYLFQMLAQANIETLDGVGARTIVAWCPHCFNTLRNEYPDFGGSYEVVHHTQLLNRLVREGRLTPVAPPSENGAGAGTAVTYHDPCHIGRHNGVYDPPRELIGALPGVTLTEMPRHGNLSFCCGAGGARMWMEEKLGTRINGNRTEEAVATGADQIAVACPSCRVMLSDALTSSQQAAGSATESVEVVDVAHMLLAAVRRGTPA
ncbi:MAG: (Fe-S)-binding protein [Actinomycetota bacterium]|nr:(Fe-S)-binding protein [Actinomycetota bacterium]